MGTLTKKARKDLPKKDFAGPGRTYPVENRKHAEAAVLDAGVARKKGRMTKAEERRIDRKADAVLKRTDKTKTAKRKK